MSTPPMTGAVAGAITVTAVMVKLVDGDPVPIGLSANRASFEELLAFGHEQRILTKPLTVDDLFPALG